MADYEDEVQTFSNPIPLSKFDEYVEFQKANGGLEMEFDVLNPPDKALAPWTASEKPENIEKHRYHKHPDMLLTYDHTRVVLDELPEDKNSDFINANWVDGFNQPKKYIATQCPTSATAPDFFRMIWQYGVQEIVNLASPHDFESGKGYKYFPEENETFGDFQVKLSSKEEIPDVIVRRYDLQKGDETRQLVHFHFQAWPDLATPEEPQQILNLINAYRNDSHFHPDKPVVIHCMAGVGRTGTFLLTDTMYDASDSVNELDFLGQLWKLRNQRISMVEKQKQYIYAHEAVALHKKDK